MLPCARSRRLGVQHVVERPPPRVMGAMAARSAAGDGGGIAALVEAQFLDRLAEIAGRQPAGRVSRSPHRRRGEWPTGRPRAQQDVDLGSARGASCRSLACARGLVALEELA